MDEIKNFTDFICNVKNVMKSYFYPKEESDSKYSEIGHTHPIDDTLKSDSTNPVQNKVVKNALDGKANTSHPHTIANITGLQGELDSKSDNGHKHQMGDVTGLQSALDGKSDNGHTHPIDDTLKSDSVNPVQNKIIKTALDGKAPSSHNHDTSYYTKTQMNTELSKKADKVHSHAGDYPSMYEFNDLKQGYEKNNSVHVRLIRCFEDGTPYPQDGELELDGTQLLLQMNHQVNVKLFTNSNISLEGREVLVRVGTTLRHMETDKNGYGNSPITLRGGGNNDIAIAILKGTNEFYKAYDMKLILY